VYPREAALLERSDDLVALEDAHPAGPLEHGLEWAQGELAADRRHQGDPAPGAQRAPHLVQRGERV